MKKVKYIKPAMQHIQTVMGGAEQLKEMAIKAYNVAHQQSLAAAEEESKQAVMSDDD